jgi:hypothetical protein
MALLFSSPLIQGYEREVPPVLVSFKILSSIQEFNQKSAIRSLNSGDFSLDSPTPKEYF